jgi:peroxiredoxin Q/BCP
MLKRGFQAGFALLVALFSVLMIQTTQSPAVELEVGQAAPEFVLPDQTGTEHRLSDYRDFWVVLYFYPKDDTPGCTKEACSFRDDILELRALKAQLFGVSLDDRDSHTRFSEKYSLPFQLLSDSSGEVTASYGALFKLGPLRYARRQTFLIDPAGRIAKIYRKVKPNGHSDEIIADLKALQAAAKP